MFINLNYIYFKNNANREAVNDVIMPKDLLKIYNKDEINFNQQIKEFDKEGFNVIIKTNQNDEEFSKIFFFVDYMKKQLESLNGCLCSWLNIIFGVEQKWKNVGKKKEQLFRTESYINDINQKTFNKYTNDDLIMQSIEFGLIPLQTIFDPKILNNLENKNNNFEKIDEKTKIEIEKIKQKKLKDDINNKSINEKEKKTNLIDINKYRGLKILEEQKIDKILNIEFQIDNKNKLGKLEIYIDDKLIGEMFDHNDKIIDVFFNERLNMFATTSYDGFACIYILPNKLFCIIKNKNNSYFDKIFLSSNPFPTIITFEKKNNILSSYSLSGLLIKERKINEKAIKLKPIFNFYGGAEIDRIKAFNESFEFYTIYNLPFFDEVKF